MTDDKLSRREFLGQAAATASAAAAIAAAPSLLRGQDAKSAPASQAATRKSPYPFRIGVMADSFRLGAVEGVRKAAQLGAAGVQVYTTSGPMGPDAMTPAKRAEFKKLCADLGIAISALCGDTGGFRHAQANPGRIATSKKIIDLAADLGAPVVTSHIGVVPEDTKDDAYKALLAAMSELGPYAAKRHVTFAVETGPEKAVTLKHLLDDVNSPGVGVNLDPANLVMVLNEDPAAAVRTLGKYVVHTHAKDGVHEQDGDPMVNYEGANTGRPGAKYHEVPLGEGGVNWDDYLAALDQVGYKGFLTIEREVGDNPAADIAKAVAFLKHKIG